MSIRHTSDGSPPEDTSLDATRSSLLVRVRDWADERSWREFHQRYHKLIVSMALQAGLTQTEAEDVLQETLLSIAKKMPGFVYDRKEGSFGNWIRAVTRHRILDAFRRRQPSDTRVEPLLESPGSDVGMPPGPGQAVAGALVDERGWDEAWNNAWQATVLEAALERVRFRSRPEHFQIFYYSFVRELPALAVSRTLGVGLAQVYVVRHRLMRELKDEVARLMTELC